MRSSSMPSGDRPRAALLLARGPSGCPSRGTRRCRARPARSRRAIPTPTRRPSGSPAFCRARHFGRSSSATARRTASRIVARVEVLAGDVPVRHLVRLHEIHEPHLVRLPADRARDGIERDLERKAHAGARRRRGTGVSPACWWRPTRCGSGSAPSCTARAGWSSPARLPGRRKTGRANRRRNRPWHRNRWRGAARRGPRRARSRSRARGNWRSR